jgi:predicted kinase
VIYQFIGNFCRTIAISIDKPSRQIYSRNINQPQKKLRQINFYVVDKTLQFSAFLVKNNLLTSFWAYRSTSDPKTEF